MDNGRNPYIVNKGAETPLAWAGASFMLCCYYESWAISLSVVSGAVIWSEEPEMRGGSSRSPEAATSHGPGSGHQQQRKYAAADPGMTQHILQHTGVVLLDIYRSPT